MEIVGVWGMKENPNRDDEIQSALHPIVNPYH